ncbi:hypothetical protein VCUG_02490 [Vavraia culicis subsp. floridensis]|uniref:UBC core domain-containing protein n=1 Tax=Vavraia culicis (isolate floridensis) TaxID=948595 RepID=L2GQW7_VAVCU|nr:uncharacterized protein VCUG_02490 [Vavraia culicis subsp. floridensis]ELA46014.1 hypothetical protein VCUG_02490 [Vavraia culicis subsp. floridensis]
MAKRSLSIPALNRLKAEEKNLVSDAPECGFLAEPQLQSEGLKDYSTWDIYINGSEGSLYEGTVLHAAIEFSSDYPITPPKMRFVSKMFHPNIYSDGKVCISTLHVADDDPSAYESPDEKWTPVHGIRTIVLGVISILNEPNIVSPANVDASKMFKDDYEKYCNTVTALARKESLKRVEKK